MKTDIVAYYRMHDDYARYLTTDKNRTKQLRELVSANKGYFGKNVLDLACGGGILGFILEPLGCRYVGIDVNPDMISRAKTHAAEVHSRNRFVMGDARTTRIKGQFDTLANLGNALIHFNVTDLRRVLANVRDNAAEGAHFILEYRDVVSMLYHGKWSVRFVDKMGDVEIVSVSKGLDVERGEIPVVSKTSKGESVEFAHAVWSPFILQAIMEDNGWRLVERKLDSKSFICLDIYGRS